MNKIILITILSLSIVAFTFSLSSYLNRNEKLEKNSLSEKEIAVYKTIENLTDAFVFSRPFDDSLALYTFIEKKILTKEIMSSKPTLVVLFDLNQCQPCLEKVVESIRKNKRMADTTKSKIIFIGHSHSFFELIRFKQFNKITHDVFMDKTDTVRKHLGVENLPTTEWILDEKGRVVYVFYPDQILLDLMEKFHNRYVKMVSTNDN